MPNLEILPNLKRRRSSGGGGPPSLSAQVQTILSGTKGYFLDPTDITTLWQDSAGVATPVVAINDPVGRINSKYGSGSHPWTQASNPMRPLWTGLALDFDGSDDGTGQANDDIFQAVPGYYTCYKFSPVTVGSDQHYFFSNGVSGSAHRFAGLLQAAGSFQFSGKRLDADGLTNVTTSAGLIVAGNTYIIESYVDCLTTGDIKGFIDGVEVATGTIAGSAGNSENTVSLASAIARFQATRVDGPIGRMIFAPFVPSAGQRTTFRAAVNEFGL